MLAEFDAYIYKFVSTKILTITNWHNLTVKRAQNKLCSSQGYLNIVY